MEFNLQVYMTIEGTGVISKGRLRTWKKADIPKVAYEYVKSIKQQTGYREMVLEKAIVNGSQDITEALIQLENTVPDLDDLPW